MKKFNFKRIFVIATFIAITMQVFKDKFILISQHLPHYLNVAAYPLNSFSVIFPLQNIELEQPYDKTNTALDGAAFLVGILFAATLWIILAFIVWKSTKIAWRWSEPYQHLSFVNIVKSELYMKEK